MNGWTVRGFLEKNGPKFTKNETQLLQGLQEYAGNGFCVERRVAMSLKRILVKEKFVKNVLERSNHSSFIDKVRTCAPKSSPVSFIQQQKKVVESKKKTEMNFERPKEGNLLKRKNTEDLSYNGKKYRKKRLADVMDKADMKLISENKSGNEKVDLSKTLNYQHDAHLSERDFTATIKIIKEHTGRQILPGKHMRLQAKKETYPAGIVCDQLNVEVPLQSALNKTVERLLESKNIDKKVKDEIIKMRNITFILKAGQDGTSGFAKTNKRTERGTAKQNIAFTPLELRSSDQTKTFWKNDLPNSRRRTRILKSTWAKETTKFIMDSYEKLEEEISSLQPLKMKFGDQEISIDFLVLNVMNDGKVQNAISTKYYKDKNLVDQSAKSLSTQMCHLCGLTSRDFGKHFLVKHQTIKELMCIGFAPMHACKNSRECILRSAFRKHSIKKKGKKDGASVKESQLEICQKLREATGGRYFEPEPSKGGNSNTGQNLKLITKNPQLVAPILDCSEELLFSLHEVLSMIESTKRQDVKLMTTLSENVFNLFQRDFGAYSTMSPSLHRALQHSSEFIEKYQSEGLTLGALSECAQEAINTDSKKDVRDNSFRGSHAKQNLNCFNRNWTFSDPQTFYHCNKGA